MATPAKHPTKKQDTKPPVFISAFDLFKPSIEVLKLNIPAYIFLLILPMVLASIGSADGNNSPWAPTNDSLGMISLIGTALAIMATPGLIIAQLQAVHKKIVEPGDAFKQGLRYVWRLIGMFVLLIPVFIVSFLLFIVPFFFVLHRVILASYYLVDRDMGIIEALKASSADAKKYSGAVWGLLGVVLLISLVNVIPVIGWLIYIVLTVAFSAAGAIRYEQIKRANEGKDVATPIEQAV